MLTTPWLKPGWLCRNYDCGRVGEVEQRWMFSFCVPRRGKSIWREYSLAECYSNINAVPTHSAVIQPQSFTSFRSPWCFELLWCIYLLKRKPQQAYSQHSSCSTSRVYFVYSKVTHNAGCYPSCFFLFTRTLTTDYIRALRHNLSPSCSICFQRIYVFKECNLKSHCNTKHAENTVLQTAGRVKKCTLREFRKKTSLATQFNLKTIKNSDTAVGQAMPFLY